MLINDVGSHFHYNLMRARYAVTVALKY